MTYLRKIDDSIDRRFLITKSVKGQAEAGTVIHVIDAGTTSDAVNVSYRVSKFNNDKVFEYKDYTAKFQNVSQFCKWAQPDSFIVRNYERLTIKDIQHYIKIKKRTFFTFCLPIILLLLIVVWPLSLFLLKDISSYIIGGTLTLIIFIGVIGFYKNQKKKEKMRLYRKISSGWGVILK